MEKTLKIKIPEGYNDAVFDKETNEIKFIKGSKLGDKVTIDGVEGYVLEVDDAGEPTILCSKFLGNMSWEDAMKKANQGPWHLPTVDEFKKYYKLVIKLDYDQYSSYWTSTECKSRTAHYIGTANGYISCYTKTHLFNVRAFAFVGSKKVKDTKPRSWEEYCNQKQDTDCFKSLLTNSLGTIIKGNRDIIPFVNEFNTEEEAKAVIALCKLIQLRDAWWGDWKPDWTDMSCKFTIYCDKGILAKCVNYSYQSVLAFPAQKMCDEFLDTFRDLLEEAKPLI